MTCDAAAAGSGRAKVLADHESWIRLCTEHVESLEWVIMGRSEKLRLHVEITVDSLARLPVLRPFKLVAGPAAQDAEALAAI
jgi:hypothetical protein